MHAKFRHNPADVLKHASTARKSPQFATQATYLMVSTYQQPLIDALWAGQAVAENAVATAVTSCTRLLDELPVSEQTTTRARVRLCLKLLFVVCIDLKDRVPVLTPRAR